MNNCFFVAGYLWAVHQSPHLSVDVHDPRRSIYDPVLMAASTDLLIDENWKVIA